MSSSKRIISPFSILNFQSINSLLTDYNVSYKTKFYAYNSLTSLLLANIYNYALFIKSVL